jgi:hypothetical protein
MIQADNKFLNKIIKKDEIKEEENIEKKKWIRSEALCKAQKIYYQANKDKLIADQINYNKEYVKENWTCPCGCIIKRSAKYLHARSPRHARRMKLISENKNPNLRVCDEKFNCECGSVFIIRNKKTHDKCKKHVDYMKETERLKEEQAKSLNPPILNN